MIIEKGLKQLEQFGQIKPEDLIAFCEAVKELQGIEELCPRCGDHSPNEVLCRDCLVHYAE